MRRNPYFQVLLALSVMQAGYLAVAQLAPVESQDSHIRPVSTTEESPVTQFNIFGRNAPFDKQSSENHSHVLNNPDNYSTITDDSNNQASVSSSYSESEEIQNPSAAASSLMPTNFSSPSTAKKPYKKPKVVLTLSLRSKESGDPNINKSNDKKNKSPFLFGNNVIKFDTRTNRLIIPTSTESLEVLESDDDSSEEIGDAEDFGGSTVISVITEGPLLEVQNQTLTALKILEKLRSLTNSKLRLPSKPAVLTTKAPVQKEPWYGFKKYETLHPRLSAQKTGSTGKKYDEDTQASTQVATAVNDDTIVEYTTLTTKVGGHIKQNATGLQADASTPFPRGSASGGPFTPYFSSTPPIVLKVGKSAINTIYQNSTVPAVANSPLTAGQGLKYSKSLDSVTSSSEIEPSTVNSQEQIKTGETRVAVTADQIGGNRPTHRPFHFGPTTQPPTTTTVISNNRGKNIFHPIGKSPHNHAYAPTQDPVSIVHNDDLSVEDFQDFRLANAVFGSKVGANVPPPRAAAPRPPPVSPGIGRYNNEVDSSEEASDEVYDGHQPSLPVRLLQENVKKRPQVIIKTTPPTTTTTTTTTTRPPVFIPERRRPAIVGKSRAPQLQASSGVKNSQLPLQNDNLPFYKEPGGVFKEHQPNHPNSFTQGLGDDEDSNFISHNTFNENRPGVKYAPKAPSAHSQPQTVYANHLNGNNNRHNNDHYNNRPSQQQHQPHLHNPQPQYVPVTQAPLYVHHQQPIVHHHQQFAVIPSPTPQVMVSPLHQRPQQQPIYYHAQQPALVAAVVPTQPLYQQPPPAAGFVPILHPQQAYAAAPVQPQYHQINQFHQNPQRDDNFPHRNDPNSDTFFGDPTPDSSPQTNKNKNRGNSNNNRANQKYKAPQQQQQQNDYHGNEDRSFQNQRGHYPPPPIPPAANRRHPGSNNPSGGREPSQNPRERFNKNDDDDGDHPAVNGDYDDGRGRNRGSNAHSNNKNNRNVHNARRRQGGNNDSEDYDPEAEAGIREDEDFVEPNFNNQRPVYDDAPGINSRGGGGKRDKNDGDGDGRDFPGNDKPFRPSPQDFGPIRPSHQDFRGPQFDHPNLEYPQQGRDRQDQDRRQNYDEGPEYDPRGFGVGHGPPPANNVQLDPIYTRTIKQFDEEHRKKEKPSRDDEQQPRRHNSHRPSGERLQEEQEDEEEDDRRRRPPPRRNNDDEEEEEEEGPRRRPPPRRNHDDDEEEDRRRPPPRRQDDDEEEEEEGPRQRPPPRRQDDEEEEEEEEAPRRGEERPMRRDDEQEDEEEEESRNPPPKAANNNDEEEEEEEEEEEQEKPPRNRQRNPGKNKPAKKRPKKPPPNEKAGDLEDDIRQINREFGGIVYDQSKQPIVLKTPSGVVVTSSFGANSPNQQLFRSNDQQQPILVKAPSSHNAATEVSRDDGQEKISKNNTITSFNIHLVNDKGDKSNTTTETPSQNVIVDL